MKTQYIGPDKILGITKEDFTTPSGDEVVTVKYESGKTEMMTGKAVLAFSTSKPSDYSKLQEARGEVIVAGLINVLLEYNLSVQDIDYVQERLSRKFIDAMERAGSYLWNGDDEEWISGVPAMNKRTLLQAEKVIRAIGKDGETGEKGNKS